MIYQQVINANPNVPYTGGWCLAAVQDAFNTDHPYPSAMAQWQNGGSRHVGRPPLGIDVPVFFSMSNEPAGHVAVHLKDGRVASSSKAGKHSSLYIHDSIDDLIGFYAPYHRLVLLGWSEVVGTKQVVKELTMKPTALKYLVKGVLNRPLTPEDSKSYLGKDPNDVIIHTVKWAEANNRSYAQAIASKDAQIAALKAEANKAGVSQEVIDKIIDTNTKVTGIQALLKKIFNL